MPQRVPAAIAVASRWVPSARRSKDKDRARDRGLPALFAAVDRYGYREQRAAKQEFFDAAAVSEKAVMSDTMEPVRHRVEQEAPDEHA